MGASIPPARPRRHWGERGCDARHHRSARTTHDGDRPWRRGEGIEPSFTAVITCLFRAGSGLLRCRVRQDPEGSRVLGSPTSQAGARMAALASASGQKVFGLFDAGNLTIEKAEQDNSTPPGPGSVNPKNFGPETFRMPTDVAGVADGSPHAGLRPGKRRNRPVGAHRAGRARCGTHRSRPSSPRLPSHCPRRVSHCPRRVSRCLPGSSAGLLSLRRRAAAHPREYQRYGDHHD